MLPTWLYSRDGSAEIVRDQETFGKRVAEGWKDSPARFTEPEPEPTPEPVKAQSPKAPVKKAVKKAVHNNSADDLI